MVVRFRIENGVSNSGQWNGKNLTEIDGVLTRSS